MDPSNGVRRDLAYIRGLMEGNEQMEKRPESNVLKRMIQLLDAMAEEHDQLRLRLTELEDYVEAVDVDLNELELLLYEEDEETGWEEEEDIGFWEVHCPGCDESLLVDEEIFADGPEMDVLCPHCDKVVLVNDEGDVWEKGERARTGADLH
ncbi:CD1247 N-terminal domain-containing protein [Paludifilum halophilum]|uniref:AraC family transcriptional regulator n=1 Tax=Paludifilum halophilum TaxID=1642702 RepID=A0A235BC21_9BACL|nr:CD1247 N-terminal domain-containing protein [Paludifilum halophilum]OYD09841.1 hypothetical protein CHM34_02300 [Paludifilum halophilum]